MSKQVEEKTSPADVSTNGNNNGNGNGKASIHKETQTEVNEPETALHESETLPEAELNVEENEESDEIAPKKKRSFPLMIVGAAAIVAIIGGLIYWLYARQYESTDDAFIEGDVVQISPKVSAYVAKVYVKGNQPVHKGDLLVELNAQDFEVRLEQAKAQLRNAQAQKNQSKANVDLTRKTTEASQFQARSNVQTAQTNVTQTKVASDAKQSQIRQAQSAVTTARANLAQTRTQIPQAQSNLELAQKEYNRRLALFNNGDISRQSLDQATTNLQTAQAQLDAARKQVDAAQSRVGEAQANVVTAQDNYRQSLAQVDLTQSQVNESTGRLQDAQAAPERLAVSETQVGTSEASIEQAEVAVHQAELDLSYTKIYAPEDGFVTRKTVEEGQLVQPGAPLMALSLSDEFWVVANFKETQLELMRVGQPVDIEVDAYPSETFHGKIESFQVGTGSRFSVLPAENATGNYVKVVQRVPVKITFDEKPDQVHLLAPGMSVEPSVKVR
ncbi:MAG TPA: HlyD family secretion protein [Pyrinomonadaceae bacterium]|nr:HlyD family secretion protein [Pyrinomonadaceae bacterium]